MVIEGGGRRRLPVGRGVAGGGGWRGLQTLEMLAGGRASG